MNYSKWDKFVADISDSDDDEGNVKVTNLGPKGGSVHIGPQGATIESSSIATPLVQQEPEPSTKVCTQLDHLSKNGDRQNNYFWGQDRYEVVIHVEIPPSTRGADVNVSISPENALSVVLKTTKDFVLEKKLRYPVLTDEGSDGCDWELVTIDSRRFAKLTLTKKSPIANALIWWRSLFEGDPDINVEGIEGRSKVNTSAWEEAHRMFREKVSKRVPVDIDADGGVEDEEEDGDGEGDLDAAADGGPS